MVTALLDKLHHPLHAEQIRELLGKKNKDGWTPLHVAAEYGDAAVVKALLAKLEEDSVTIRELLNEKNNYGKTPLDLAASNDAVDGAQEI